MPGPGGEIKEIRYYRNTLSRFLPGSANTVFPLKISTMDVGKNFNKQLFGLMIFKVVHLFSFIQQTICWRLISSICKLCVFCRYFIHLSRYLLYTRTIENWCWERLALAAIFWRYSRCFVCLASYLISHNQTHCTHKVNTV